MNTAIRDTNALTAVSPGALSAYALSEGWARTEPYGEHSDVYVASGKPEVILPKTQDLGDYPYVVAKLIEIFAGVAETDEFSLYRNLITADRDVVRVRANGEVDGSIALNDGIDLMRGARDMFLAAACSLSAPRPIYRLGANKEANRYIRRVRLGQTEQGSFIVTMLTPRVSSLPQELAEFNVRFSDPVERRMTVRLIQALNFTRSATGEIAEGDSYNFGEAVRSGVSANLCEALAQMVGPFPALDVSLTWARTRPRDKPRETVSFFQEDAPHLTRAANTLRNRVPRHNVRLTASVQRLERDAGDTRGTVILRASIEGKPASVRAVLNQRDYARTIQVHNDRASVIAVGDLERVGQRWHLLNPSIVDVVPS